MIRADLKPLLIDLDDITISTGRKQETNLQRERLSEEGIRKSSRVCRTCSKELSIEHFCYRGGTRKGLQADCKSCSNRRARTYRQSTRDRISKFKMERGCELCSFKASHPCQLDLDHVDPMTKAYKGSHKSFDAGWSWARIEKELAKCQVICKNCHSLKTYMNGDWINSKSQPNTCDSPAHDNDNCE